MNGGTSFKTDNRLKPRFLNTVAEKLNAKLPESNLKAQPHVHSRLRQFKGIYNIVHDIVVRSCTSGFGWDPETKSVVVEKEVWKADVKDRASGKDAQGPEEMEDEVNEEEENEESSKKNEPKSSSTQEPSGVEASSGKSGNLGKWVSVSDNLVKGLSEAVSILRREIRAASSNISRVIGFDIELSEKHSKLNEELANLGLTTMERYRVAGKIASESESFDVFFSIPNVERKEWVQALLRGDI
ncbi:hypothetical protein Cgig2_010567 [Carnegiea gigantea]|uniref:Myb/SANT-like domain-containing protein n=1 Tax=Carnegiea gigantea TaxID=171969 RepID=A0A9Q1QQJ5_9CARY|nr:hypothetical protein Cgig2_010567 [Carnegiea gigantea]